MIGLPQANKLKRGKYTTSEYGTRTHGFQLSSTLDKHLTNRSGAGAPVPNSGVRTWLLVEMNFDGELYPLELVCHSKLDSILTIVYKESS
jgi:hypothetical protein